MRHHLTCFHTALKELYAASTLRKTLQTALKWSSQLFTVELSAICFTNPRRQTSKLLILRTVDQADHMDMQAYDLSESQQLDGWFNAAGQASLINDANRANLFFKTKEWKNYGEIRNALTAPLKLRSKMTGILLLLNRKEGGFTRRDLAGLKLWAEHVALAIDNSQRFESERDFNRELKRQIHATTDQLRAANAKLQEADLARSENISMIAHELRSPVTSVSGFAKLLLKGGSGDLNNEQAEFCTIIQKNAHSIERLISDLLDLTKLELGKLEMNFEFILCQDLIREAVFTIQGNQPPSSRRIRLEIPTEPLYIRGDRHRLLQVMSNLLSNALKYSPPNTPITAICRLQDSQVVFAVEDRGDALNVEQRGKIFEKFYRIKNMTRNAAGSGLGLAISQICVTNHGGQIWVENASEGGNVFCFSLPRIHDPEETRAVFESLTNQRPSHGKEDHIQN